MFVIELGQIIRKITKIITDTHLDVVPEMAVYPHQHAASTVLRVGQIKPASLDECIPTVDEVPVRTHHIKLGPAVEILGIFSILGHLSEPIGHLTPNGPTGRQIIHDIY